jgi:hypothetical protein
MRKSFIKLGHKPKGTMNKTEAIFAENLELERLAGKVKEWGFEKIKLRLGDNCFYTIDFYVVEADDQLKLVEVKGGFITAKGMVKFKTACELFPFIKFVMVQIKKGECKIIREN